MARERVELVRHGRFREKGKIFVLSYEGNDTEPQYYEALRDRLKFKDYILHIESLRREKSNTKSAPKHVFQKLKEKQSEFNFRDSDEFWMIVDKDRWELNEWVEKCQKEKNFHIAISNPCFEFWLLLHVYDIKQLSLEEKAEILINRKVSNRKRFIDQFLANQLGNDYNKANIKPDRFLDKIDDAINQASMLDQSDIMKNIGSHNYQLVKKLIE